jgi:NAD-dependent DNA ligase
LILFHSRSFTSKTSDHVNFNQMATKATIAGNTFRFNGKLKEFTCEEAEAHVEAEGGEVLSRVSAKSN